MGARTKIIAIFCSLALWPGSVEAAENMVHLLSSGTMAHFNHNDGTGHAHETEGDDHHHHGDGDRHHDVESEAVVAHHDAADHGQNSEHDCSATAHVCGCCPSVIPVTHTMGANTVKPMGPVLDPRQPTAQQDLYPRDEAELLFRPPRG